MIAFVKKIFKGIGKAFKAIVKGIKKGFKFAKRKQVGGGARIWRIK